MSSTSRYQHRTQHWWCCERSGELPQEAAPQGSHTGTRSATCTCGSCAVGTSNCLEAAIDDQPGPDHAALEQAWLEICTITAEISKLRAIWRLLERAATQQHRAAPDDERAEWLTAFLDQAAVDMLRAQRVIDLAERTYLDGLMQTNFRISSQLLQENLTTSRQLDWLGQVGVSWGCLGLWDEANPDALTVAGFYSQDPNTETLLGRRYMAADFPPIERLPISSRDVGPDLVVVLPVRTATRDWGILVLCAPVDGYQALALDYMETWATLLASTLERGRMVASMQEQQETLRIGYERERALSQTVRELGCPVIPLLPGVLLIPLIGVIDSERAQQMLAVVLQGVSNHQAETVLLDITGVPLVDTQVANTLIQLTRTVALVGSRVILVGVRPEFAQSIVGLGVSLGSLATQSTLAAAVASLQVERSRAVQGAARQNLWSGTHG